MPSHPTPRSNAAFPPRPAPAAYSAGVIPIRGITPPTQLAAVPAAPLAFPARLLKKRVPVERRPLRVLLVPATPGARTRAFDLARWQARLVITTVGVLVLIAAAATTAVVLAFQNPEFFSTSAEAASLRTRLLATEDSLLVARTALLTVGQPLSTVGGSAIVAPASPRRATIASRRPTLMARISGNSFPADEAASAPTTTMGSEELPARGRIASGFTEARWHPLLHMVRPHLGVDVAAPRGTRIVAPAAGRVSFVGRKFAFGLVVEIDHGGGIMTRYAHCRSALVKAGDRVKHGQTIARVGSSGLTTGPHLHYEVLVSGRAVDPMHFRIPQPGDTAVAPAARLPDAVPSALGADGANGAAHEDSASGAPGRPQR